MHQLKETQISIDRIEKYFINVMYPQLNWLAKYCMGNNNYFARGEDRNFDGQGPHTAMHRATSRAAIAALAAAAATTSQPSRDTP